MHIKQEKTHTAIKRKLALVKIIRQDKKSQQLIMSINHLLQKAISHKHTYSAIHVLYMVYTPGVNYTYNKGNICCSS